MKNTQKTTINFADFAFERDGNVLFKNGAIVPIEPSAAKVLRYFLENRGRLVSKEEILDAVWSEVFTTEDVLKRAVSQIRRVLGDDPKNSRFIETLHRRGYRFHIEDEFNEQSNSAEKEQIKTDRAYSIPQFDCFVGRKKELEFLQTELKNVLRGVPSSVLITGDPGSGKTQTSEKFSIWANQNYNFLSLRLRFFDYEAAFLPPIEVFLKLLNDACEQIFSQKIEKQNLPEVIRQNFNIQLPVEIFSDSQEIREKPSDISRIILPLIESFISLSRLRPLLLIFDDIQWADETSQIIIGYLMRMSENSPLMMICLSRKDDAENSESPLYKWIQKQSVYRSFRMLELQPITTDDCLEIISEIFQGNLNSNEIPSKDIEKLHRATAGNPYFFIETLRLLLNENLIFSESTSNGISWHWRGIEDIPLPETVRLAARAKFDKLSQETLEIVQCAAVLGDTFQINTLKLLNKNLSEDEFEDILDQAINLQVLSEENVSGEDDCQFYHTTLRRAIYMDLSPRRLQRLHKKAMQAIEISHEFEIDKFSAVIASHAEIAKDFDKSFKLNLQACQTAVARFDWLEAFELITRANRVAEKAGQKDDPDFLALQGEILMSVGKRIEAEKILKKATEKLDSVQILLNLGRTRILLGNYQEALPHLEKALKKARLEKNEFLVSATLIQIASAKYALCQFEDSTAILQKIIDENNPSDYNRAVALGKLGWTRALQSRYVEAKKLLNEALEFHQNAGDLRERAVLAMCLNWCEYGLGNYESAIEFANQARREAEIVGEPYNASVSMMRIAKSRIAQGIFSEAEKILEETRKLQKNLNAKHAQAETIWMVGRLNIAKNELIFAEENLQTALEMIIEIGDRDDEFRILIDQSYLNIKLGNFAEALELAESATKIAVEIEIEEGIGEALIPKSLALLNLDKIPQSIKNAGQAVEILGKFNSGIVWLAHQTLAKTLNAKNSSDPEIEKNLLQALKVLDLFRHQFSDDDEPFYVEFTRSMNLPAKDLFEFYQSQNLFEKSLEVKKNWLID